MVRYTLKQGLRNMTVLDHRTPKDVIMLLLNFHNAWHGGSAFTLLQYFDLTRECMAGHKTGRTSSGETYASTWDWVCATYPEKDRRIKSGNEMQSATVHLFKFSFAYPPHPTV
eukprot:9477743-Pyramimonas_sp.AAC.1